ncbi:MAG: carboxymuconolactone decarboxylase family protein, partial [Betaproteobacteria bacterium]
PPELQSGLNSLWYVCGMRRGTAWGGRPTSLVVVSVLAATGHNEELKTHLRGALNLGWTVDELREALLQMGAYAGFSAAHEALDVLSEIITQG